MSTQDIPLHELGALQCIAALPEIADGSSLQPHHFFHPLTRNAIRYARDFRSRGLDFGAAELAKASGASELAPLLVSTDVYGQEQEKLAGYEAAILAAFADSARGRMLQRLEGVAFNLTAPPAPKRVVYSIGGVPVCTAGNITVVSGLPGSAKSSFVAAFMAAAIARDADSSRTLGITGTNTSGGALLHFDTEQDPCDAWMLANRALKRAQCREKPSWFRSYALAAFKRPERFAALLTALEVYADAGAFAVLIDGAADIISSVNDEREAIGFVDELHQIAIRFACPVIVVVHINPGLNAKTRGHLGSELTRKCENEFLLKKADGETLVTVTKHRHGPIAPFSFKWSESEGMFSLCTPAKDAGAIALARNAFDGDPELGATEAIKRIQEQEGVSNGTAKTRWRRIIEQGIAVKNQAGKYRLAA